MICYSQVAFLCQKGLIFIRPFLLAFTFTAIFMFPIVSSFMFRHPTFFSAIGFSLYDANFYVGSFFRKVANAVLYNKNKSWFEIVLLE